MEKLVESIKDILELDEIDVTKRFSDYEEWDSLSSLSLLAILDSEYHIAMKYDQIMAYSSIEDFCKDIIARQ